jgi:hypothetical protein
MSEVIQPVAFTIDPAAPPVVEGAYRLTLPSHWLAGLALLQGELRDRPDTPNTPGWRSLSGAVAALVPHLLAVPDAVWGGADGRVPAHGAPWLLAHAPIDTRALFVIIRAWLIHHYQWCPSFTEVSEQMAQGDLSWEPVTFTLSDGSLASRTANPSALAFRLLPALLADRLTAADVRLPVVGQERVLVRVPLAGGVGAELVTWPPVFVTEARTRHETTGAAEAPRHAMSYTLTLTLQTLVGEPEPRLHVHYGVRRWLTRTPVTEDGIALRRGRTSAYLRPRAPWFSLGPSKAFSRASIEMRRDAEGRRVAEWADAVPDIARFLGVPFPDVDDLLRAPEPWLTGGGGAEVAIVLRAPRSHPIAPGLDIGTQQELTHALAPTLDGLARLVSPVAREQREVNLQRNPMSRDDLREMSAEERLAAFVESVLVPSGARDAAVEIYWETAEMRDRVATRLRELLIGDRPGFLDEEAGAENDDRRMMDAQDGALGVAPAGAGAGAQGERKKRARKRAAETSPLPCSDPQAIALPNGGTLSLIPRQLDALAAPFPTGERSTAALRRNTDARAHAIAIALGKAPVPTLAIVELPHYSSRTMRQRFGRWRDPKPAIRLGLARTGRVSQFITPPSENKKEDDHRALSAGRDGLRHLGYLPAPIGFAMRSGKALPPGTVIAAVWNVRLTKKTAFVPVYLPVVVVMPAGTRRVSAWLPDGKGLRSYRQALLDLVDVRPELVERARRPATLRMLKQFLLQDLPVMEGAADAAILVAAQNARGLWEGIANKALLFDHVRFAGDEYPQPARGIPGRPRLIRLRTSENHETPEWYIPASDEADRTAKAQHSIQGLWRIGNGRTYYNIGSKPRVAGTGVIAGKNNDPTEHEAVASILEIVPAVVQDDEEIALWPVAINQWRHLSYLWSDMTLYPLPMHFAVKMEEYARVIASWLLPDTLQFVLEEQGEDDEDDEDAPGGSSGKEEQQVAFALD